MIHRPAVTLIEVLVSIFVVALGLLGLMALFPVGAFNMAQGLKDARSAQAAGNGAAVSAMMQVRTDPQIFDSAGSTIDAYTNPNLTIPSFPGLATTTLPNLSSATSTYIDPITSLVTQVAYDGQSYPVYVDPLGAILMGGSNSNQIGFYVQPPSLTVSSGLPRRTVSFVTNFPQYLTWFALGDDITFGTAGLASLAGTSVQRESRYSWAYMVRRPRWANYSVVDLDVVVYNGRSSVIPGDGPSNVYAVDFVKDSNSVTVKWGLSGQNPNKPVIRNGNWILDATVIAIDKSSGAPKVSPDPHGNFYRVVNVTEGTTLDPVTQQLQNYVILELQRNIKKGSSTALSSLSVMQGILVVMDNVIEVFEKGSGWVP